MKWLHQQNCPMDTVTSTFAAQNGDLVMLGALQQALYFFLVQLFTTIVNNTANQQSLFRSQKKTLPWLLCMPTVLTPEQLLSRFPKGWLQRALNKASFPLSSKFECSTENTDKLN